MQPLNIALAGRRVLIVDDVADTGDTFVLARTHIAAMWCRWRCTTSWVQVFEPDFYAERLTAWRWINYPWARIEDIAGFIARLRPRTTTAAPLRRRWIAISACARRRRWLRMPCISHEPETAGAATRRRKRKR
ncbi:MAG: hypothetical protein MZV65_37930 [Chromatiales bacterium]|nr:hypothetical protein [Chromatiales bacterium]